MRRLHHSATNIERRRHDAVGAEPLQGVHGADDVDDGVEGADFMEVDLLDRHVVNRGLGFRQALEQCLRAIASGRRQCRLVDQLEDPGEVPMRMRIGPAVFADDKLRRRDPRPEHALRADLVAGDGEASERGLQPVERQAGVEQRAEHHVARDAGEAVEIQDGAHRPTGIPSL